jgi:septum formation protein
VGLILASSSPRRRDLLTKHGYDFTIVPADVTEHTPEHLTPGETVLFNARAKATAVAIQRPLYLVVGVDTLVSFEGRIFGKPADLDEAWWMLSHLNGRVHEVFSGVWLAQHASGQFRGFIEVTRVHFHHLAEPRLRAYMQRIGPLDKAGAYAAQDDRGELIESVEGSFTNVVGLPMERLAEVLREFQPEGLQRAH